MSIGNGLRVRRYRGGAESNLWTVWAVVTAIALLTFGVPEVRAQFGDGSDGSLNVFAGTYNIVADMNYVNVIVFPGTTLNTNGFTINVSGTLLNQGTITDLTSGGNGGPGGTGGNGGFGSGASPQIGAAGVFGSAASKPGGGNGGRGGGGGGGGGVAWDGAHSASGGKGGNGGIGGKGGGVVKINAFDFQNVGIIHADGQNGGTGSTGVQGGYDTWFSFPFNLDLAGGGGGGGGGGYGGNGGTVNILYGTYSNSGVIRAFPGSGGGGAPGGSGRNQSYSDLFGSHQWDFGAASSTNGGVGGNGADEASPSQGGQGGFPGPIGAPGTVSWIKYECCVAQVGNVDCSPGDGVDVADLTALIDNLFITFSPLCCQKEANGDGDPLNNIDVADLTALIDNLFINFATLPPCN